MTCPRCGSLENDTAKFCSSCGGPLSTTEAAAPQDEYISAPPAAPEQEQYVSAPPPPPQPMPQYSQTVYTQQPVYHGGPVVNNIEVSDYFVGNLILLILNVLACCTNLFSLVLSIIGLVYSVGVRKAKEIGSLDVAESKAKTAKILFIISLILYLVIGAVIVLMLLVAGSGFWVYFDEYMQYMQ